MRHLMPSNPAEFSGTAGHFHFRTFEKNCPKIIMLIFFHILLICRNIPSSVFWTSPISQLTPLKKPLFSSAEDARKAAGYSECFYYNILCMPHPSLPTFFLSPTQATYSLEFNFWSVFCGDQYNIDYRTCRLQWITTSWNLSTFFVIPSLSISPQREIFLSFLPTPICKN